TRTRQPASSNRAAVVRPEIPAPNTATRIAPLFSGHRHFAHACAGSRVRYVYATRGVSVCKRARSRWLELLDVCLHLIEIHQHRPPAYTQRVSVAGLMDIEDGLNGRVEPLHVEGLIDGTLGLTQSERWHLGDLFGQGSGFRI